ncbi:hypothetical protein [Streptomyces sp. SID14515]|uniref:DUF7848 domain-containing protein n=1 Tax=Streptomyces sp. SID14515 TaxID=2706074 RepID=UPI0019404BCA|nr:hypothetical protein [Streptomyces sp. SID14515]
MSLRAVVRFVQHGIGTAPQSEVTMTARCLSPECGWTLDPTTDQDAGNDACMSHTGRTRHSHFARVWEDVAEVRRLELDAARDVVPQVGA